MDLPCVSTSRRIVTICSSENSSSCFNPHSDRVKLKPSGGSVLGGQVSEVEADSPARANAGAGAIPLVEPGSEFLFAIKFHLGHLPVCGAGFGVFPVNGFWLCGNFGLAEAAKAAQKAASQATQAASDMATEMASGNFTGKKTSKPRQSKPRATSTRRAKGD